MTTRPRKTRKTNHGGARPRKTRKTNHGGGGGGGDGGGNSATIDDLDDHILTQILFKLPSCAPIISCKLLNKRWYSLISNPKFAAHFSNHKKEITSLSEPCSNIDDDETPWSFIATTSGLNVHRYQYCGVNDAVFGSSKFSPGFLPCNFHIKATFKDLVLCSCSLNNKGKDPIYYITNPLTKQWVALPPCPGIIDVLDFTPWVGLVCQEPYDYTQDYKFRVVVIDECPLPVYKLLVYCSEIGEWKKFKLSVSVKPELKAQKSYEEIFQGVVCNGIIYFQHRLYFAAFNPFDVDETTDTRKIEAKVLPSSPDPVEGYLQESSGQLFIVHNSIKQNYVWYNKHGSAIEFPLKVWKLDPNQVPLIWETTFEGLCTGNVKKPDPPFDIINSNHFLFNDCIGMHPNNDKLIYLHLLREKQLVLCDTRTRLIKPLKDLSEYDFGMFYRLELQWWPTSVPKAPMRYATFKGRYFKFESCNIEIRVYTGRKEIGKNVTDDIKSKRVRLVVSSGIKGARIVLIMSFGYTIIIQVESLSLCTQ